MIYQSYYDTYSGLTTMLMLVANSHKNVADVNIGEVDDYTVTGRDVYPMCFFELPIQANFTLNTIQWNISVTIVDQVLHERTDEQEKINSCFNICQDLIEAYKDLPNAGFSAYSNSNQYWINNESVNIMTLTRFKDDFNAGVRLEFMIEQSIPVNTCILLNSFNV